MMTITLAEVFEDKQQINLKPSMALKIFFDAHLPRYKKALEKKQSDAFRCYINLSQKMDLSAGGVSEQGSYLPSKSTSLKNALRDEIISLLVLFLKYKKPALFQEALSCILDIFEQVPGGLTLLNRACQKLSAKDYVKQCALLLSGRRNKLIDAWKARDLLLLEIKSRNPFEKSLPCQLEFEKDGEQRIECETVLRFLPNKRVTFKARWNDQKVVVKVFYAPRRGKNHFQREHKSMLLLQKKAVNSQKILYAGPLTRFCHSVISSKQHFSEAHIIVLEFLEGQTLAEKWRALDTIEKKESLLKRFYLALAKVHNKGCYQADLHLANFIESNDKIYMLDADLVKHYALPLTYQLTLQQLGLLFAQFSPQYDSLLIKMSEFYFNGRTGLEPCANERLEKICVKNREGVKEKLLKKIFRDCTGYIAQKNFLRRYFVRRTKKSAGLADFLSAPDTAFAHDKSLWLKNGNTCSLVTMQENESKYVIKRYNLKNFFHMLKCAFKKTRARISWKNAHLLQFYGINTPSPVGYVEKRIGFIKQTSYFVMEYLDSEQLLQLLIDEKIPASRKEKIIREIELIWTLFYRFRISHGDLKHTNWLVHGDKVFIIDLDSLKQHATRKSYRTSFLRDKERFMKNFDKYPLLAQTFKAFFLSLESR